MKIEDLYNRIHEGLKNISTPESRDAVAVTLTEFALKHGWTSDDSVEGKTEEKHD